MKYGFGRTAAQVVCTIFALCFGIALLRQDRMQTVFSEESVTLPIIMYHSILKDSARQGKYVVSPEVLASDLDALRERGYETVTVEELVAYTQSGAPLPKKPVMLTFDDGYYNNYVYACPLLRQRGMRAVVSIIGSQTALFTENGEENAYWSHLRAERLRETEDVFEVQNHSWNLHEYGERRGCLRRRGEDESRYADLLRGGTLDAERRRTAAEALYHESARLESLSQQLLALNGLQTDGVVLRPVRVAAAFADAVRSLPDVVLDCDAPAEAVVLADRVLLADLVRNLALNAWHAGPQDGAVHLRCTDAGECWRLTVQDTGCGIPAEALPHLTEPFYRVDKARARANGGSGVGLALCAQIAEAFGTQMTFASRVGEGTTVTILLQKEAEHEEAAQQQ